MERGACVRGDQLHIADKESDADYGHTHSYHGANGEHRYCLGALLLDLEQPWKVLARSRDPIMEPIADYERTGFFGKNLAWFALSFTADRPSTWCGGASAPAGFVIVPSSPKPMDRVPLSAQRLAAARYRSPRAESFS